MIAASGAERPARARELAGRLSALFCRDVEIVERLNDAQRRLRDANERLWSGLSPDAFGVVYDGAAPAGTSQVAALVSGVHGAGGPDAAVLVALQQIHWTIHRAFRAYGDACEERRRLAVEVGEVSQQLTDVLCAAGWSADDAQAVDVHDLARRSDDAEREGGCSFLMSNHGHGDSFTG
jgi:hypothetical protein